MMTNHQIQKPQLFISHASSDGAFADAVRQEIEKVFANGVSVFCTSSPGTIAPGVDWLAAIEGWLASSQAVIAIVTPVSIERPWLWFEIGATWSKGRKGDCRIYPLCAPEINVGNLPAPLDRLQSLSMGKAADLRLLFEALIQQFGFGKISSFKASNITGRIPKYKDVQIRPADLSDRPLYSGRYMGYGDEELKEVIDTHVFAPDEERVIISPFFVVGVRSLCKTESCFTSAKSIAHWISRRVLPNAYSSMLLSDTDLHHRSLPTISRALSTLRGGLLARSVSVRPETRCFDATSAISLCFLALTPSSEPESGVSGYTPVK